MKEIVFPLSATEFTRELLTEVISRHIPGAGVADFKLIEIKSYGEGMVSSAGRAVFDLTYTQGSPNDLPPRVVIKTSRDHWPPHVMYSNEVNFYERLRPDLALETPQSLGGAFDPETAAFGLIMEDLRLRDAQIMNVLIDHTLDQVRAVLDTLAKLHARFWNSPRFETDLAWLETHVSGDLYKMFNDPGDRMQMAKRIKASTAVEPFKREMVQRLGVTLDDLLMQTQRVQRHQATLPQTIVHGDMHVGNTYQLPDGGGGVLDWQLMVRGYFMHDVSYYLATSLQVGDRRRYERDLIAYYLEKLKQEGVQEPPDFDAAWLEYRRAAVWNVYIGWLTCPVVNYGWEICVMSHLRVMTAYEDLETAKVIAGLP
jgi:hypothetical protein